MTALRPARMNVPGNKTFKMRTLSAVIMGLCVGGQAFAETNNNNDAAAQDGTISVITVIGEKTERSIYDTGSSVEVYDEDRINTTPGASEIDDLLQLTPNIVDSGHGNNMPAIRGLDSSGPSVGGVASFAGTRPRLNLSVDGRSLTYSEIAFGPRSLWDMQQVEIYLGPQSYVQGRNAMAGAVVMKSKDPTHYFESSVKGAIGQNNYSQTAAMISAPVIQDEVAFRLSVDQQKRKSHIDMASYEPVGDADRIEMTTARAKVLFEPSSLQGFKSTLGFTYMNTRSPQSENPNQYAGRIFYPEERPVYIAKSNSAVWDVSWAINDALTFENNLVYSKFEYDRHTFAEKNPALKADFTTDGKEFHIEPLVRYNLLDSKLHGLVGVRYFKTSQDEKYMNSVGDHPMDDKTTTTSAFAEATYALRPTVDVTLAARFEREERSRNANATIPRRPTIDLDYDNTSSVFLPKVDVSWKPKADQTVGISVGKGYNSGGAGLSLNKFVPYEFKEEFVWNYELYTRHRLNDSRLELTSNVFYNDFDGLQIEQALGPDDVIIENVDSAKTYGAEAGARFLATADLELFASVGVLRSKYTETADQGGKTRELPRAPKLSGSIGALYTFADGFEFSANANYSGSYFSERTNDSKQKVDAYWVTNAQLAYVFDSGRVAMFVQNAFDSDAETFYTHNQLDAPLTLRPRQIGASVELNF
ncbi:TonB-dependent receptor domain-containing protein [Vibrio nigripulchritudo]|uniref:TonB-dependent receptor domain-containing protein n=1 Tax=Vibrio nigripulchritudo TaxID=28173 RepID=UPI0005F9B094|nr:TonB-dependent receptor [Vibrio nigripulchritudo]KJY78324.1 ligand-gated channel protein [Vibrio nigripulchritudo]